MGAKTHIGIVMSACLGFLMLPCHAQPPGGDAPPPARRIPGINADDAFPDACVSCHVKMPDMDARLSIALKAWTEKVDPKLLARAQMAMPPGATLKGRHPSEATSVASIPAGCMDCHGSASGEAPAFARLVHTIHLTGGDENHFMTLFQGECTHCHKLDPGTGDWSVPSGAEK